MRALAVTLLLAGCVTPPPAPGVEPERPTLETVSSPTRKAEFVLRGDAPGALVVRVTVDRACRGPALLELSPGDFAAGVSLDLIIGQNVFTAQSISAEGKRSECSAPLEVTRFIPASPEPLANIIVRPGLAAATRTFNIIGVATPETTVRLHLNSCLNDIEQTLASEAFATTGFSYTFERDGFFTLAFDAIDEADQRSLCSTVNISSKITPPSALFDYGSPQPTPESSAWFVARGDFRELRAWSEPDCQGIPLGGCSQANGQCVFALQQASSTWQGPFSAALIDSFSNTSCVLGLPFLFDATASTEPHLFVSFNQVHVRVHAGRDRLDLFESEDCSGTVVSTYLPSNAIGQGLRDLFRTDGGVFSARSYVAQTTPDPCSLPLYAP